MVTQRGDAARFNVRVHPRAPRNGVDGVHAGTLRIRVTAPPVDGAANEAVASVLAEWLGVAARDVRIVAGGASRSKLVEVDGVSADLVRRRATEE
jgi:uncharacterized protein (TIGR00251 family)